MQESSALVNSFREIAKITGGRATYFQDASQLINVVCENILHDIGGMGLVEEYRKTYGENN